MTPRCVFCSIVDKNHESFIVHEDELLLSFLDKRPVFAGHTLLIPKIHVENFDHLPVEYMQPFFTQAQKLSLAIQKGLGGDGTFIGMNNRVSQSVPHLHTHVIPRNFKDGLRGFFWPRQQHKVDHMQEIQMRIKNALAAL